MLITPSAAALTAAVRQLRSIRKNEQIFAKNDKYKAKVRPPLKRELRLQSVEGARGGGCLYANQLAEFQAPL